MAAIYSNGGNRWNILGFNFTKRDALSSVYKISMVPNEFPHKTNHFFRTRTDEVMNRFHLRKTTSRLILHTRRQLNYI
jgi:hypothetical protein